MRKTKFKYARVADSTIQGGCIDSNKSHYPEEKHYCTTIIE